LKKKSLPPSLHRETLALRASIEPSQYGEHSEAIFLTSGFVQPDSETMAHRFANPQEGYTYGRTSNPTVTAFETRLAAMEGTEAAIGAATGMGAILMLCLGLLRAGDHVVCSRSVFGSTLNLIGKEFGKFGVASTFVSQTDVSEWKRAVKPNTKLLFAETPTNPLTDVCDIAALADIAHNAKALLAVDNCFCTPALQRPIEFGADLIIHSGTKHLDGQGRVMAGAVCGPSKTIVDVLAPIVRTAGMTLSPFNAWVVLKGLETLGIRMQAQSANALVLAQWLESHPSVARVYYPGLKSHGQHELAMKQQSGSGAAVVSFDVKGATPEERRRNAFHVIDSTQVVSIATNLGDVKTIVTHPATTSHGRLTEEQRQAAGIGQGLIRMAVGLEHVDDVKADLSRGLETI
jgi:O-succinylhomoserine sulfhydrylase